MQRRAHSTSSAAPPPPPFSSPFAWHHYLTADPSSYTLHALHLWFKRLNLDATGSGEKARRQAGAASVSRLSLNKVEVTWMRLWSSVRRLYQCSTTWCFSRIQHIIPPSLLFTLICCLVPSFHFLRLPRSFPFPSLSLSLSGSFLLFPLCRGINQTINVTAIYIWNVICKKLISTLSICTFALILNLFWRNNSTGHHLGIWKKEQRCIHLMLIAYVTGSMWKQTAEDNK